MKFFNRGLVPAFRSVLFMSDGGAAALFADGGGGGGGGGDTAAGGGAADSVAAGGGDDSVNGGGGADFVLPEWAKGLSADSADAETLSDQKWLENKKYADVPALVKAHRALESQLGAGNRIAIPKEGDAPEKFEAYYKAIGRPDSVEGYTIELPEGANLDETLFGSFREAAFKANAPASVVAEIGKWFVEQQLDANAAIVAERDRDADAKLKEWGGAKDQNLAYCTRAMSALGLTQADIAGIQQGFGAGRTLDLLQKLGAGMAEDVLITGGSRQRFGITGAEAQAELTRLEGDKEFRDKLYAKDPTAVQRRQRLIDAIAADKDARDRSASAA
ncbi:hypothetical protein [Rhizorhabdus sp.]|uniref:hypothetical protein n=1 Tax=Rhizorhabdus sp. TaxID=1968843 RepID=UPI0035B402AB